MAPKLAKTRSHSTLPTLPNTVRAIQIEMPFIPNLISARQLVSSLTLTVVLLLALFTLPNCATSDHSAQLPVTPPSTANVTDLIVNISENVLLECSDEKLPSIPPIKPFFEHAHDDDNEVLDEIVYDKINRHEHHRSGRFILSHASAYKYIWCRYEEDWVREVSYRKLRSLIEENVEKKDTQPFLKYKTCFEGDRHFVANENRVSTVIYRCGTVRRDTGDIVASKLWKLYVDEFATVYQKRDTITALHITSPLPAHSVLIPAAQSHHSCHPPRCKPYATVIRAQCSSIELNIRYPSSQYGYNRSTDHWGTVNCEGTVNGYQLWLIGYGVVKKFRPSDPIIMDNLLPGKRYCFNGWAFNGCGSGPVFTLEGVCAKNTEDCNSSSDEHCELDVDYSY